MVEQQSKRRPWTINEGKILMGLWDTVGSVMLIALMMDRSASSIQTQASRLGLPPRAEEKDKHRRRWLETDDDILVEQESIHTHPDGRIDVKAIALAMGRSIDAILSRLEIMHGEDSDILSHIIVPTTPSLDNNAPLLFKGAKPGEKEKECLKCRKVFWSEGKHNWVCVPCKRPKIMHI